MVTIVAIRETDTSFDVKLTVEKMGNRLGVCVKTYPIQLYVRRNLIGVSHG